ncbi:unnamed protein product, partial [Mesorhabditis belari]|uniref:Uncharacterized protein n=1 Tax=Mesorhabditis belari TaxID=2138241 RepID=A0AAF3EK95_9BILA
MTAGPAVQKNVSYEWVLRVVEYIEAFLHKKGTYMENHGYLSENNRSMPFAHKLHDLGWRENWRHFLGLRRDRFFSRHVLLPASFPPTLINEEGRLESVNCEKIL